MSELKINEFVKEVGENNIKHGFRDADLKPTETYYREDGKPEICWPA